MPVEFKQISTNTIAKLDYAVQVTQRENLEGIAITIKKHVGNKS
jgi:hypothetical protein